MDPNGSIGYTVACANPDGPLRKVSKCNYVMLVHNNE